MRIFKYLVPLLLLLVLVGCAAPAAPAAPTEAPAPAESGAAPESSSGSASGDAAMKVAMVTSGPTNDHGWNADALKGIQMIQEELGWEYAFSENVSQAEQANVLRQYAQQGYDLVFAHGYEWGEALTSVAPDFPDVHFVQINSTTTGPNISGTVFRYGELGYFTGMAAGLMTKNGKIGIVAAQEAPQVTADTETMQKGIEAVKPDADVSVSFVGSWDDVVKGQQVVQAQIDRGVDILIIMGNAFTPPAIKLAEEKGIMVIPGWSGDGYDLAPNTVITSGVQEVPGLYLQMAQLAKDGELEGNKVYEFGFSENVQHLGKWGDSVPQEVRDQVEAAVQEYLDGKLDIGLPSA